MFLYDSAQIQRKTFLDSNNDGILEEVRTIISTIKCRFTDDTNNPLNKENKRMENIKDSRKMYVQPTTDIIETDRVVFDGQTYKIRNIYKPRSFTSIHHKKVYLEAVEK